MAGPLAGYRIIEIAAVEIVAHENTKANMEKMDAFKGGMKSGKVDWEEVADRDREFIAALSRKLSRQRPLRLRLGKPIRCPLRLPDLDWELLWPG